MQEEVCDFECSRMSGLWWVSRPQLDARLVGKWTSRSVTLELRSDGRGFIEASQRRLPITWNVADGRLCIWDAPADLAAQAKRIYRALRRTPSKPNLVFALDSGGIDMFSRVPE